MMANGNGALHTLERNRFYYGKPMDVRQWEIEQSYGIEARGLLTMLGLGSGVLCGLGISLTADGCVLVDPGVAVAAGREIVVPTAVCLPNPAQPTDCTGKPDGDPVTDGSVTIRLCYHECQTEPAKAVACGCDTVERCEYGIVQERYCLRIDRDPPVIPDFPCTTIYPDPPPDGFDRRHQIFDLLGGQCAAAAEDCVVLGTVTFAPRTPPSVDPFAGRRSLYSNETLFELILCLSARVDNCCREHAPPPPLPPRVAAVWPPDKAVLGATPALTKQFLTKPRVEITFDRAMDSAELAAPDPWLAVYSFRLRRDVLQARRIGLTLQDTATTSAGGMVATYVFDAQYKKDARTARVLVQLRADDGGGRLLVDTSAPAELLDGEHHGTALTPAQLGDVWTNVKLGAGLIQVDTTIWDALLAGAPPAFPSGEGTEGGQLDLAFSFQPPATLPRLKAVWPPSAAFLRPHSPNADERAWLTDFLERPRIELTFEDTVDVAALTALPVADWLGLWWIADPTAGAAKRFELAPGSPVSGVLAEPSTVTLAFRIVTKLPLSEFKPREGNPLVVVVRGDKGAVDADFASPALGAGDVDNLFASETWPAGTAVTGPSSLGVDMADGSPGGAAVTHFDIAQKA